MHLRRGIWVQHSKERRPRTQLAPQRYTFRSRSDSASRPNTASPLARTTVRTHGAVGADAAETQATRQPDRKRCCGSFRKCGQIRENTRVVKGGGQARISGRKRAEQGRAQKESGQSLALGLHTVLDETAAC
ncbi:hypothetical protein MRX96_021309 [Rhipicephalus microplus]